MTTLEHALAYLARGWSIVPLVERTKRPAVKLTPYLDGGERMTPETATAHWTANPGDGIAVITGAPSGLVVVDVDPRNGGSLADATRDCSSHLVVQTGSGGLHFYCSHPGGGRISCGKTERVGVDRKADGGYVVAPPSLHPDTGEPYTWLDEGETCAVPAWVLRTPAPLPTGPAEERELWVSGILAHPEQCNPGEQHETLTRLAWWASKHVPADIGQAMLCTWTNQLPLSRPHEPWTPAHVKELLESAYRKRVGEPTSFQTRLGSGSSGTAGVSEADEIAAIEAMVQPASDFRVQTRDDWIVENIAAPACFTELVGEVKKGKTTLMAQLVAAALNGTELLGFKVRKTPVLLATEQAGLSLEKTLERAGIRHHPDLHLVTQAQLFGRRWHLIIAALLNRCTALGSQLLIIDTLSRLAGLEGDAENSAGSVAILDPFREAKLRGIACVFVRHSSKSKDNRNDVSRAGRGSSAISGEMDICALLYQPGELDVRRLRTISRLGEGIEATLEYRDGLYVVTDEGTPTTTSARKTQVTRAAIERAWNEGHRAPGPIAKATGLDRGTVRRHLRDFLGGMAGSFTTQLEDGTEPPTEEES